MIFLKHVIRIRLGKCVRVHLRVCVCMCVPKMNYLKMPRSSLFTAGRERKCAACCHSCSNCLNIALCVRGGAGGWRRYFELLAKLFSVCMRLQKPSRGTMLCFWNVLSETLWCLVVHISHPSHPGGEGRRIPSFRPAWGTQQECASKSKKLAV